MNNLWFVFLTIAISGLLFVCIYFIVFRSPKNIADESQHIEAKNTKKKKDSSGGGD